MRKIALAASVVLLAAVGVACSHASATKAPHVPAPAAHNVTVNEGDMYLRPSATKLASGKITFQVTNHGSIHHEFVIVSGNPTGTKGDEPGRVSETSHIGGDSGPGIGD